MACDGPPGDAWAVAGKGEPFQTGPELTFAQVGEIAHRSSCVRDIEVDRDGRVFVADGGSQRVVAFRQDGELLGTLPNGKDPDGGLAAATDMEILRDTLYVFDTVHDRVTLFGIEDDRLVRARTVVLERLGVSHGRGIQLDAAGSLVIHATHAMASGQRFIADSLTLLRLRPPLDEPADLVLRLPPDEVLFTVAGQGSILEKMPFGGRSILRVDSDGTLLHVWTPEPWVTAHDPEGAFVARVPLPSAIERAVSRADVDRLAASILQAGEDLVATSRVDRLNHAREENRLPASWPVVKNLIVDSGQVWVELMSDRERAVSTSCGNVYATAEGGGREVTLLDSGTLQRRTGKLPTQGDLMAVRGGRLYVAHPGAHAAESIRILLAEGSDPATADREGAPLGFVPKAEIRHDFGSISSVAVAEDRVFVGDSQANLVWVFGSDGELLDSIGRTGEGPGDFMSVRSLQTVGGTLHVFDDRLARVTAYDTDLRSLRVRRTVTFLTNRFPRSALVAPDGSTIVGASTPDASGQRGVGREDVTVHRVTGDVISSYGDTLLSLPRSELLAIASPGFSMAQPAPFARRSFLRIGVDGTVFAFWTGEKRIRAYDPTGTMLYEAMLPEELGRPVLEADYAQLVASVKDLRGEFSAGFLEMMLETASNEGRLPSHWPVATGLVVDDANRLWVTLVSQDDRIVAGNVGYSYAPANGKGRVVTMLDPREGMSRSGRLPGPGWVGAVWDNDLYLVVSDALGVESVRVFGVN